MKPTIQIVTWKKAKKKFENLNPVISKLIDEIPNSDQFELIRLRYPFGYHILKHGVFHLFDGDKTFPFKSKQTPKEIRGLLDYDFKRLPVGIVSKGAFEAYIADSNSQSVIPLTIKKPGNLFAVLSLFNRENAIYPDDSRNLSSGARSLFMLPPIASKLDHEKLKRKTKIKLSAPKYYQNHWQVFSELTEKSRYFLDWHSEIFLFPKEILQDSPENLKLRFQLLQGVYKNEEFKSNEFFYHLVWSRFLKNQPLSLQRHPCVETAKHIVKIMMKQAIAFRPATNNNIAPIKNLQNIYLNQYQIRNNFPTIMQPEKYNGKTPVYYSTCNTFSVAIPKYDKKIKEGLSNIIVIRQLLNNFKTHVVNNEGPYNLENGSLYKALQENEVIFFHEKGDHHHNIFPSKDLLLFDKRFYPIPTRKLTLAHAAPFFHGCVCIMPK